MSKRIEEGDIVDVIAAQFRENWSNDSRPVFEEYLSRCPEHRRDGLLQRLVSVDLELRNKNHQSILPTDYESLGSIAVEQVVGFLKEGQFDLETRSLPPNRSDATSDNQRGHVESLAISAPNEDTHPEGGMATKHGQKLGVYRIEKEIGKGGMGVVYKARHEKYGNSVALKTLPLVDGMRLHKFKREFRALADIHHPNLIGLHTLGSDGSTWFFTMDLIDGVDFESYVRPNDALNESRLRSCLSQLIQGLTELHTNHQIIHRDLKPHNVIVDQTGHLTILDFGLISETQRNISLSENGLSGTPAYMAPEQAQQTEVSPATDWYAVGIMLYEALSGGRPFSGSVYQLIKQKTTQAAPPLPSSASIPNDLAKLCLALLDRDPQKRPGAAELRQFTSASSVAALSEPEAQKSVLIGREEQLTQLENAYSTVKTKRNPVAAFVSGKSGEGKSSLIEQFLARHIQSQNVTVLSGRCYDRESVPFKALDSLIDALASYMRTLEGMEAALLLPDDIALLAQVFPILNRVEAVSNSPSPFVEGLDDQQVRTRAFNALRELLRRLGGNRSLILFIDDIQWGDADSANILAEILRPPGAPSLLFIGSFRSDEAADSPFLNRWNQLQQNETADCDSVEIKVGPLSTEQCVQMGINFVGRDTAEVRRLAERLANESGGNPFLLSELLECCDWNDGSFRLIPMSEVIEQKLRRLPAEARDLLNVVAISGQAMFIPEATVTAGESQSAIGTLTAMRNERLIRLVGGEDSSQVDTYHDKIRETVLGGFSTEQLSSLHRSLAIVIERNDPIGSTTWQELESGHDVEIPHLPRVYDLAYHFDAAGDQSKALVYGLLAAEQAGKQYALDVSTDFYGIAKRNSQRTTNVIRYRIATGYCKSLTLLGRYKEATQETNGAIDLTDDAEEKAHVEWLLGDLAYKQGRVSESIKTLESGLRRLGIRVPKTKVGWALGALKQAMIQAGHSIFRSRLHKRPVSSRRSLAVRIHISITQPYLFSETLKAFHGHLSGMNHAELQELSSDIAKIYGLHAGFSSMLGWQSRGEVFGNRFMQYADQFDDIAQRGFGCSYYGIGLYGSGRYDQALETLRKALEAIRDSGGDMYEFHLAKFHLSSCHFGLGNLRESVELARSTMPSSFHVNDSRSMCLSWVWARATLGNLPFERIKCHVPDRPDDVMSTVHLLLAEGLWHNFHGRSELCLEVCKRAGKMVRESGCLNAHTVLVLPMLGMAYRQRSEQTSNPKQKKELLKSALKAAKWGARFTRLFPAGYPLATRELGLVYQTLGKPGKALRAIEKSCKVATKLDAKFELAQSNLTKAKLKQELGNSESESGMREAENSMKPFRQLIAEITSEPLPAALFNEAK